MSNNYMKGEYLSQTPDALMKESDEVVSQALSNKSSTDAVHTAADSNECSKENAAAITDVEVAVCTNSALHPTSEGTSLSDIDGAETSLPDSDGVDASLTDSMGAEASLSDSVGTGASLTDGEGADSTGADSEETENASPAESPAKPMGALEYALALKKHLEESPDFVNGVDRPKAEPRRVMLLMDELPIARSAKRSMKRGN